MTAHKRRHTTQPFALCKLSYCYLWRYLDQHVDVVRAYLRFDNLVPFPIAQRPQNASNFSSFLSEEHFPSVFWRKHYMIFAIPTGMR